MFRSIPADTIPTCDEVVPCDHPVPLSVLALDLGGVPAEGWAAHLGKQGVPMIPDDLGRNCVSRQHARLLLDAHREDELRQQRFRAQQEQAAVEADRRFRASLPPGLPASAIPEGVTYGDLVRQAAKDARPRRRSPLEEALAGESLTYHELPRGDE